MARQTAATQTLDGASLALVAHLRLFSLSVQRIRLAETNACIDFPVGR